MELSFYMSIWADVCKGGLQGACMIRHYPQPVVGQNLSSNRASMINAKISIKMFNS